ncbi:hypothetical protein CRU92_03480 [Arcobacter sp. FW59]|nr:hypothetical protein CRU92_03480 [Arcobacter sp. FW59]
MEKLYFNIFQVIEETKTTGDRFVYPTYETFKSMEDEFNILIDGIYYEVIVEKTNDYIWFSFDFGKPNPRDNQLTDIITGEKRENDRELTEAELIQQFFCLYCFKRNLLYISNSKKKNTLSIVFKEKMNQKFSFKTIQKTKDEFISILEGVNEITFTETKHLFSFDSKKREALKDLTGIDSPNEFTISAKYTKSNELVDFIKELFLEKKNNTLKDLIIRGNDEDNFEIIFNNDSFSRKIEIQINKDENGKYLNDEVKNNLLKEL